MLYTLYADGLKLNVRLSDDKTLSNLHIQDPESNDTITIPIQSTTYLKMLRKAITEALDHYHATREEK
jgi:hypothetical protein